MPKDGKGGVHGLAAATTVFRCTYEMRERRSRVSHWRCRSVGWLSCLTQSTKGYAEGLHPISAHGKLPRRATCTAHRRGARAARESNVTGVTGVRYAAVINGPLAQT